MAGFTLNFGCRYQCNQCCQFQHIESLNEELREITGTNMQERILDSLVARVDEVVNSGCIAKQLIDRLKAGKIYEL